MRSIVRFAAALILLAGLFGTPMLVAQTSKGILAGVVRDSSGAVIAGAGVTVTNQDTGETRKTTAAHDGTYRVDAINPGNYTLDVSANGFSTFEAKGIIVNPSVVSTYDAALGVGVANSTVEVAANSNTINTENGQLSGTISSQELQKLPIFTLNPAELVATLPGVQFVNPGLSLGGSGGNGSVKLIVNGARPRSNNFMIDSEDVNDVGIGGEAFQPILPDMFANTTALLSSSSAEFGRSGGAVINQVTKSGTNQFHGSLHEIYTGSGLDSRDGQTRQGSGQKARYDQHQYGFTVGGPIIRNKLFAFGGGTYVRFFGTTQPNVVELPDAIGYAQLTAIGGAQATLLQSYLNNGSYLNTANFQVIANNAKGGSTIPISPRPGCTAGCSITTARFQRNATALQQPDTQWMYRIDSLLGSKDTFSMRYFHDRSSTNPYFGLNPTSLPGFDAQASGPSELGGGTWTHVFTSNLLNEFRASETRINFQFGPVASTLANPTAKLANISFGATNIPNLGVSQNMPQGRGEELYQFQDTVGWTKGRQSFRIGADVGRLLETDLVAQNALGALGFTAGGGLSSIDNFLNNQLGTSGTATKTFGPTRTDPHLWKLTGFVQDDIKLTSNLTINLGIRYDYWTNPLNTLSYPAVDMSNPFQAINTYVAVKEDKNNIAPRIGFAFVPHSGIFADGKTVLHGGFGIFYDPFFTNILVNSAQSSPVAPTGTLTSVAPGGLTNASGLIATITPAFNPNSSVQSASNNLVNPETYQYNFGVERALPFQLKATVNYVGARSMKLYSNRQLNYFVKGARLNPSRGVINVRDNRADSNYNGLQVQVDRNFSKGIFVRASYTYSKNLDDSSEVFTLFASPTSYSANLAGDGLRQDWGNSAFDRRHVASFVYAYTPAGFHSSNFAANLLLSALTRHFTISGQTQLATGTYQGFNVSGRDINGDGSTTNDRPILSNASAPFTSVAVDGGYIGGSTGTYYDYAIYNASPSTARVRTPLQASQAHFLVPAAAVGVTMMPQEIGRNSFKNPGQQFWNLAVEKAVPVHVPHLEDSQFVFRVEAQDVGNHNNVGTLGANVTQVGLISYQNISNSRESTNRHLRLWAKFNF